MRGPMWWLLMGCTTVEVVACAPEHASLPRPEDEMTVTVDTENWDAARLRVYCDGEELTVIRNLAIGLRSTGTVRLGSCQNVVVVAESMNGDLWQSAPIQVERMDTLLVHLMADPPQSWFRLAGARER